MLPAMGSSRPASSLTSVDLPLPLAPSRAMRSSHVELQSRGAAAPACPARSRRLRRRARSAAGPAARAREIEARHLLLGHRRDGFHALAAPSGGFAPGAPCWPWRGSGRRRPGCACAPPSGAAEAPADARAARAACARSGRSRRYRARACRHRDGGFGAPPCSGGRGRGSPGAAYADSSRDTPSSQSVASRSRWLVGSSRSRRSGAANRTAASATRMRQPPEKSRKRPLLCCLVEAEARRGCAARAAAHGGPRCRRGDGGCRRCAGGRSRSRPRPAGRRAPYRPRGRYRGGSRESPAPPGPSMPRRRPAESWISPPSGWSAPAISLSSVDLPRPLRPTRPTRALRNEELARSNSVRPPTR